MPHLVSSRDQRNTIWDTVKLGGVLKKELGARLRSRHRMRHAQNTSRARQPRGRIIDGISIRDHPADVEDPATPDHWEGDLITGSQNTHISHIGGPSVPRYLFVRVQGKDTISVVTALSTQIRQLTTA